MNIFLLLSLQTTTTATASALARVSRDGGDVLNATDLHARTSERTKRSLGTRTGGLGLVTTSSTELDVEGGDSLVLARLSHVLGGKHSSVGGSFVTICLH